MEPSRQATSRKSEVTHHIYASLGLNELMMNTYLSQGLCDIKHLTHWPLGDSAVILNNVFDIFYLIFYFQQTHGKQLHPHNIQSIRYTCNTLSIFQTHIKERHLAHFLSNCPQAKATKPHWCLVNVSSGNGLLQSGNKLLPKPMLTQTNVTIQHH